jgi:hypothetical protein
MKPGTIWLQADAELPVRIKTIIVSDKRMLVVCWGIHEIAHYCRLPKESTLDSTFFREELFNPLAQKVQPNSKTTSKPLTLVPMDNASIQTARAIQEKLDVS